MLHRRPAGTASRPLRAQPGRRRPHRRDHRAARRADVHRCRPRRRGAAAPADREVWLRPDHPERPGRRGRPLLRRTDRGNGRCHRGRGRGLGRTGRHRDRRHHPRHRRPHRARPGGPNRPYRRTGQSGRRHALRRRRHPGRARSAPPQHDPLPPSERQPDRAPRRPCRVRPRERPGHPDLHDADAASDAHRHCRPPRHAGSGVAGDRARCRRRLRPEDVAGPGVRGAGLAGPATAHHAGLGRGPAREPDGELSQPRHVHHARGRLRAGRSAAVDRGRRDRQCRRLRALSEHRRRRTADVAGRIAGTLRLRRLRLPRPWRRH